MNIDITGKDWEQCQLYEYPELKQEILDELKIQVDSQYLTFEIGDLFTVYRKNHSGEFFQFMVVGDESEVGEVVLCYYGCGS